MSDTDKTRPWWVKAFDPATGATTKHDHRASDCRPVTFAALRHRVRSRTNMWQHYRKCPRHEWATAYCPDRTACQHHTIAWRAARDQDAPPPPPCPGHARLTLARPDLPCDICAAAADPCTPGWPGRRYGWSIQHVYGGHSPGRGSKRMGEKRRRAAARTALHAAARDWNANGDTDIEPGRPTPHPPPWW